MHSRYEVLEATYGLWLVSYFGKLRLVLCKDEYRRWVSEKKDWFVNSVIDIENAKLHTVVLIVLKKKEKC